MSLTRDAVGHAGGLRFPRSLSFRNALPPSWLLQDRRNHDVHLVRKWHFPEVVGCLLVDLHPLFLSGMLASRVMDRYPHKAHSDSTCARSLKGPRQKKRRAQQAPSRLQALPVSILGCHIRWGETVHSLGAPEVKERMCPLCGVQSSSPSSTVFVKYHESPVTGRHPLPLPQPWRREGTGVGLCFLWGHMQESRQCACDSGCSSS